MPPAAPLSFRCVGTISFDELDRKAAASLEKFRVMSLMHHPSIEDMWKANDFLLDLLGI